MQNISILAQLQYIGPNPHMNTRKHLEFSGKPCAADELCSSISSWALDDNVCSITPWLTEFQLKARTYERKHKGLKR